MLNHIFEIVLHIGKETWRLKNQSEIFKMIIESIRDNSVGIDTVHHFLLNSPYPLMKAEKVALDSLFVTIHILSSEQFIKLKAVASGISKCIWFNIFKKLRSLLLFLFQAKEVLKTSKCLLVLQKVHKLGMFMLRHFIDIIHGIIGLEERRL